MPHINGIPLPPAMIRLLDECRAINYGRIESLKVQGGVPVFDSVALIVEDAKLASDNDSRPATWQGDYEIKPQVAKLLQRLERMGNGRIKLLEVQHGLPFRIQTERRFV